MRKGIFRWMSVFCSLIITLSCFTFSSAGADEPSGRMASVYAYTLNDYIYTYGSLITEGAGDSFYFNGEVPYPNGVVYSETIDFEANGNPYLVIFLADAEYATASCHIWKYNEERDAAERIAILDANYSLFGEGQVGTFSIGFFGEKRYIIYKLYENDVLMGESYYTAMEGDAFRYVNPPMVENEIGVMDFSCEYFHSGVDISQYNLVLNMFFDKLKNTAADSVTYDDIAERLSSEDEERIEAVLKTVTGLTDFDIASYPSMETYREAVESLPEGDRFYLISEAYDLGDEIYYIRFSTDRSYYNYALLRRSDDAENGYQILKVRTDCIPLSDRELRQIKTDYDRNTLLYKKAKSKLKLSRRTADNENDRKPLVEIDKTVSSSAKLPIVCVGGGIAVALLTILWVYLYSDSD